ncbi:2-dehydropantoate 2-reductase [Metabacillus litoralis]|uniref:2-dehydropantoate 2-reductase n=1 Tax=Metabacillus litoralis TaxID=152268 RepID=UPI0021F5950B|nr:2-dehydropantoate 2-reductase [Metabacillus litoralis]
MDIGVIGAGSLGLLYSYYLSKNYSITLYTNKVAQADSLNNNGLTIHRDNNQYHRNIHASAARKYNEQFLIVTVKQYQLKDIIEILKSTPAKIILFLQNGMGHLELLSEISHHQIILGISEHGALKMNETTVQHTGIGLTKLALFNNQTDIKSIQQIIEHQHPLFSIKLYPEWEKMLKEKLIVNATINPLTSLLRVKNGALINEPYFNKLFHELFLEVVHVLGESDVDELWLHVQKICENTAENISSMYKDLQQGNQTEIDSILGYLIDNAQNKDIPYIRFLYQAIKGIEE